MAPYTRFSLLLLVRERESMPLLFFRHWTEYEISLVCVPGFSDCLPAFYCSSKTKSEGRDSLFLFLLFLLFWRPLLRFNRFPFSSYRLGFGCCFLCYWHMVFFFFLQKNPFSFSSESKLHSLFSVSSRQLIIKQLPAAAAHTLCCTMKMAEAEKWNSLTVAWLFDPFQLFQLSQLITFFWHN